MELHVRACSARNLIDKQTFGKQDPYCKLTVRNKSARTRVHDNGHKTPVWNEVFVFSVVDPQLDQLVIEVKDKNFTTSTLIGDCRLPVNMFLSGSVADEWYPLNNRSKRAGEINLRVQFRTPEHFAVPVPMAAVGNTSEHFSAQAYPYPQQPSYLSSQPYPPQPHYQQQPPPLQYSQPPPPHYGQPPALQYGQQPYYPPPPAAAYGYPPPPPVPMAYAAGPSMMGGPAYGSHDHHQHGSKWKKGGKHGGGKGFGGFGGGSHKGGRSTGQMAMGVGAGLLGGMLLGEALDDVFD